MTTRIRTKMDIRDLIDRELSWRKKELSLLKSYVKTNKSNEELEKIFIRSATMMLYAHFEGFFISVCKGYVTYVVNKRLKYRQMSIPFRALAIHKLIGKPYSNMNILDLIQIAEHTTNGMEVEVRIDPDKTISSGSNLKSSIIKKTIRSLGLDYSPFELKERFIDSKLVHYRNNIAHGKDLEIDRKEYFELHDEIIILIDNIGRQIANAVNESKYIHK